MQPRGGTDLTGTAPIAMQLSKPHKYGAVRFNALLRGKAHGPRASRASFSVILFACSTTRGGTHLGKGSSRVMCRPEDVCSSCTWAICAEGNRFATRTNAGQSRRWM